MSKSLQQYLYGVGFRRNPFSGQTAEDEKDLPQYFVRGAHLDKMLGDPEYPMTTFYFAARGNGKSATARMVQHSLTGDTAPDYGAVLVIYYDRRHFEELLNTVDRSIANLTRKHYRQSFLAAATDQLDLQKARLRQFEGVGRLNFEATTLSEFAEGLQANGVRAAYFLIDGVDELQETATNPQEAAKIIYPLLTDLDVLHLRPLAFKFFLPVELENELYNNLAIRFDRFEIVSYHSFWREEDLNELLASRLTYYSDNKIESLGQISDIVDMDTRLCRAAAGSPRNLIRLANFLLDEHFNEKLALLEDADTSWPKISEQSLKKAIDKLRLELKKETSYKSVATTAQKPSATPEVAHDLVCVSGNDVYIGGKRLENSLAKTELKLLQVLYDNRGKTCSRDFLLDIVYEGEIDPTPEQLDGTVKRVRQKLNSQNTKYYIEVAKGVGFFLKNYTE
jgi:hypothetical protein